MSRHQHRLIVRLATLLRTRMSKSGHLLQAVTQESRGNCLPPSAPCGPACREAQDLVALTESYLAPSRAKPVPRPLRLVTLKAPKRRAKRRAPMQPALFGEAV